MSHEDSRQSPAMLTISPSDYNAIRAHGEETYPHECCGVLIGHATENINRVAAVERAGNTRTDRAHDRYNIAPEDLIRIQRQARAREMDIVGFYHSHPDHPAQWSQTDFAEAHWVGCSYIITSVANGTATVTNCFLLTGTGEEDKQFVEEQVQIETAAL